MGENEIVDIVQQWRTDQPTTPVVVLGESHDEKFIGDVLSVGATEWLPRGLAETAPSVLRDRLCTVVEREHAQTSAREIFDNVGGVAILHDPDTGEMLHANETLVELLGQDRAEIESKGIGTFTADLPGYDHEWITQVVSSVTEQDEEIEIEWPVQTAEGGVRWTEARVRTVHVGGRKVVLTTSVDITERRREERKYQQVFDNVNDVITVHDPWNERIVDVNQTMTELTGYSRATLLEMGISGLSVSDAGFGTGTPYERQQRIAATGDAETVEWTIETAAGEQRRLETNLAPATIAGRTVSSPFHGT
ncbi:PAS domain-containing protein [Halomicroarcula sp. GCM10025709]|uniref:PAS domain-containing protein n=1 Tax=Halomicroarcula sp. GCM10025709 TaxID=3252669 RepID=UPI00361403FE